MKKRLFIRLLLFALGAVLLLAIWALYSWGMLGGAPLRRNQLFTEVWNGDTNEVLDFFEQASVPIFILLCSVGLLH